MNSVVAFDEKKVERPRPPNDPGKVKEACMKVDKLGKLNRNLLKTETNTSDQTLTGKYCIYRISRKGRGKV